MARKKGRSLKNASSLSSSRDCSRTAEVEGLAADDGRRGRAAHAAAWGAPDVRSQSGILDAGGMVWSEKCLKFGKIIC